MSKIKLLVDGHWFDDLYQSPSVFLRGLYDPLALDGDFELFIGAHNTDIAKAQFKNAGNIQFIKLASQSKFPRLIYDFPRIIKKCKIDVAHFQYISPLIKTCKEIVTIHDLLYRDFKSYFPLTYRMRNDFLFNRSAQRADLITAVSGYSVKSITKHFNIPPSRIKLVPNGMHNDFFVKLRRSDHIADKFNVKKYILCVSRIEPRKNHILLLKAFAELKLWEKDISLVFIGRQDIRVDELDSYLSSLPKEAQERVHRLKDISEEDLKQFYVNSIVTVYPSFAEGFGIPPLEAASLGAKVLCSNSTAMADFDFFGEDLFDPSNELEFKSKLERAIFIENDKLVGDRVSDIIQKRYNWETIANEYGKEVKRIFG
jgi:glycosyltransferase involved in cell wall biosynthesis